MAFLEILNGDKEGERYELANSETILGRYPFCDIVLAEKNISRQHTRIIKTESGFAIEDMNSLNGTRIEGRRELEDQDRIHIYEVLLLFSKDDSTTRPPDVEIKGTVAEDSSVLDSRQSSIVNALDAAAGPRVDVFTQEKLSAVLEITRVLGSSLDFEEVLPNILEGLFAVFKQSDRGYILLEDGGDLHVRAELQKSEGTVVSSSLGPISQNLADRVMENGEAVLIEDAFDDADLDVSESVFDFPIRSVMCAPMMGPLKKPLGIIYVDTSDPDARFEEEDLDVLLSVAAVAGQAVEYARAHERNLRADRRDRELSMAKEVQSHFLPQNTPAVRGYQFFDYYQAAEEIGGDYHGYIQLPDDQLAIAIADVSGKGVSAALLMARFCSDVRYCLATSASPEDAVMRLNQELSAPGRDEGFITFSLAVLNPRQHELTVVNAGHMPPYWFRAQDKTVETIGFEEGGPPLGCDENMIYRQKTISLAPGDVIVMYTDGISEAMNYEDELFGNQRIREALQAGTSGARVFGRALLQAVNKFISGRAQSDDMCLVCASRNRE